MHPMRIGAEGGSQGGMKFKGAITGVPAIKNKLDKLGRGLTRDEADTVGRNAVEKMKEMISKGLSPVRGGDTRPRFPKYLNPKRYPGKKKPASPVNLQLTGAFLKNLGYKVVQRAKGWGAEIGYDDPEQIVKEQGHREMANGQPHRPTIPMQSEGEAFARSVEDSYLRIILGAFRRRSE